METPRPTSENLGVVSPNPSGLTPMPPGHPSAALFEPLQYSILVFL